MWLLLSKWLTTMAFLTTSGTLQNLSFNFFLVQNLIRSPDMSSRHPGDYSVYYPIMYAKRDKYIYIYTITHTHVYICIHCAGVFEFTCWSQREILHASEEKNKCLCIICHCFLRSLYLPSLKPTTVGGRNHQLRLVVFGGRLSPPCVLPCFCVGVVLGWVPC